MAPEWIASCLCGELIVHAVTCLNLIHSPHRLAVNSELISSPGDTGWEPYRDTFPERRRFYGHGVTWIGPLGRPVFKCLSCNEENTESIRNILCFRQALVSTCSQRTLSWSCRNKLFAMVCVLVLLHLLFHSSTRSRQHIPISPVAGQWSDSS